MSAASASDDLVESVQSWFVDNFLDDETQLFGGPNEVLKALDDSLQVCRGLPALVTRSSTVKTNGACPEIFTAVNGSCTCLSGFDSSDEAWEFRIQATNKDSGGNTTSYPVKQATTDTLKIDAIQTLYVPNTLQKL